ncbi:hypothetical protein THII_1859 [Thioploca ingrica]|uniref:Uncharacterized protein n=1 Tax=Thioploca ingrica TaxID=40754 RepID=A0A090BV33_9GAMM|nr:hypothetical protein THII_1859 [Thioploca ingrica]
MKRSGIQDYDSSTRQVGYPVPAFHFVACGLRATTCYYYAGCENATQNKKQFANQRKLVVDYTLF